MYLSRRLVPIALALLGFIASGCALRHVNSFVERGFDVTRYRTYNWAGDDQRSTGDPRLDNNPFFQMRVQADVDKQLARRGFEKTTPETADLIVHYYASVEQRLELNGADQKYGSCKDCTPYVYDAGTLVIDLVDARTKTLVWRGWAEGSIDGTVDNQSWLEERIDQAVTRILERLPRRS